MAAIGRVGPWRPRERRPAGRPRQAARRLLAEAEALDRALERAPLPSLAEEAALADRILAAARRSPRMVAIAKEDAARWPGARSTTSSGLPSLRARPRWLARTGVGGAAGMLAASLALGVFIGLSSLSQGVLPALEK